MKVVPVMLLMPTSNAYSKTSENYIFRISSENIRINTRALLQLCENMDTLNEPEARASMILIIENILSALTMSRNCWNRF